jgi:hypothetical protein
MDRQARTRDTVLGGEVKTTENKIHWPRCVGLSRQFTLNLVIELFHRWFLSELATSTSIP